jgi:ribonuclease G
MTREILVNVTPRETRVALVENGILDEVHVERAAKRGIVGNVYHGRVSRVLPGMQAAFVDVGLERTAFLHASDVAKSAYREAEGADGEGAPALPDIRELLREGAGVLVQALKDPLGSKGARLTTHVSLPSRYLVYLPDGHGVGLSTRIEDEAERQRLRDALAAFTAGSAGGGYIVRTAAEGATAEALHADMLYLNQLWAVLREQAAKVPPGALVHEDHPLAVRILRDLLSDEVDVVRVDSRGAFERMREFCRQFVPQLAQRVELYPGPRPLFELHGVEEEIQRALERKVPLKSGGYLMLDQTEAMTTIDVNTGAYVGKHNLEETILKTNLEAAQAIARQLRLRNLGGIIIIDFIDMSAQDHRDMVLAALQRALAGDHAKTHVSSVSPLGLVEMTRKRTRESLEHQLCDECPTCAGRGSVKSPQTVCYEVFREVVREARQFEAQAMLVLAAPTVVELMLDEESTGLAELEAHVGRPIRLQAETGYPVEQFDVVPL